MSSSETSGAPAEATATTPASDAAFPTFGSTRGSGLARGKRPSTAAASTAAAAPSDYKPTAIEVVSAPREYTNPFAPAEAPASASSEAPAKEEAPVAETLPVIETVARPEPVAQAPAPVAEEPAELNILPPAEQRTAPAQTWESEGFAPARDSRRERAPRHEEQPEEVDIASIPPQFLYVREGVKFVPTPRNWGGAPRERRNRDDAAPRASESPRATASSPAPAAPAKSGGFLGWLKGLFGGSASEAVTASSESTGEHRREGGQRRHRGGRGGRGGEGGQRRHRGGRGRGRSYGGESEGTRSSGSL
jgi:translation initiation factor IF-2